MGRTHPLRTPAPAREALEALDAALSAALTANDDQRLRLEHLAHQIGALLAREETE